jgi:hypothetical protein
MPSRRWLLRTSVLAGLGAATLGVGAGAERDQVRTRLAPLARRFTQKTSPPQPTTWSQTPAPDQVELAIAADSVLRTISPSIYGVSVANSEQLAATHARVNRWGGNPNSRYNWLAGDAWNAARDWEFRNYGSPGGGAGVPSRAADQFVQDTHASQASAWITVPALGWVARDGDPAHLSTGVPAAGGAPLAAGGDAIEGYDPTANRQATSMRSVARQPGGEIAQDDWVKHLVERFGSADSGGVGLYAIDNEPDLWATTHTDVHPVEPDYAEMLSVFVDYASAIKDVDPAARISGPALSGWLSLLYSARDRGADNFRTHADRRAHGDMPFLAWWLDQLRQHEEVGGRRLLDVIDVHFYPQAEGVYGTLGDEATQRRRLRSTRSLWDGSYVDESWIGETISLIPRLRAWRDQFYPGIALGIGEWNWGADDTLNGALAIANVLGIFGREGVDVAAYWTSPAIDTPGAKAFALYTNYDGQGSTFGDLALHATSTSPDDVALYASRDSRSGDILTVLLNQRPDTALPVTLRGAAGTTAASWFMLDHVDQTHLRAMGTITPADGAIRVQLPPESLSLMRLSR